MPVMGLLNFYSKLGKGKFEIMTLFQMHLAEQIQTKVISVKIIFSWDLTPSTVVGKHLMRFRSQPLQFSGSSPKVKTAQVSSEPSMFIYGTTRLQITEDRNLNTDSCKKLKKT